ncbi:hypothetical protein BDQ12DRAFT_683457 [Crucibulum laeve]|uniref:Uncharacterized protein n=1 Tax=Crucibulum laeve TaxID=68775 RepID=A0A5C3M1W8_9AGAR|nr:hypothetical protein BDQ12DRAFT_683457 [Crucibulum laeve]
MITGRFEVVSQVLDYLLGFKLALNTATTTTTNNQMMLAVVSAFYSLCICAIFATFTSAVALPKTTSPLSINSPLSTMGTLASTTPVANKISCHKPRYAVMQYSLLL